MDSNLSFLSLNQFTEFVDSVPKLDIYAKNKKKANTIISTDLQTLFKITYFFCTD